MYFVSSLFFLNLQVIGAEGGIRTPTPYGATPSRWCVCQFRHFRMRDEETLCTARQRAAATIDIAEITSTALALPEQELLAPQGPKLEPKERGLRARTPAL